MQSLTFRSSLSYPFRISLSEIHPTTMISGGDSFRNMSELSTMFGGLLYGFPCSAEAEDGCGMTVELMNYKDPSRKSNNSSNGTQDEEFEVSCHSGVIEDHVFQCASGEELMIRCDGSFTGIGRRRCPLWTPTAACKSLSFGKKSFADFTLTCDLTSFSEATTICDCKFLLESHLKGHRHLSESSQDQSGPVQFSIQSIGSSVITQFVSTWEVAPALSVSDVQESVLVLTTMCSVALVFLLVMSWTMWHDDRERRDGEEKKSLKLIEEKMLRRNVNRANLSRLSRNSHRPSQLANLDQSLPTVFKSDSLWNKFKEEMKVYHRWLGIVFYYSPEFPRSMRALSLFSSIVIMLFIQSVTY